MFDMQKLKFVENPKETLPAVSNQMTGSKSTDRFRQRIYQLVRRDDFSQREVDEYIKVSDDSY